MFFGLRFGLLGNPRRTNLFRSLLAQVWQTLRFCSSLSLGKSFSSSVRSMVRVSCHICLPFRMSCLTFQDVPLMEAPADAALAKARISSTSHTPLCPVATYRHAGHVGCISGSFKGKPRGRLIETTVKVVWSKCILYGILHIAGKHRLEGKAKANQSFEGADF